MKLVESGLTIKHARYDKDHMRIHENERDFSILTLFFKTCFNKAIPLFRNDIRRSRVVFMMYETRIHCIIGEIYYHVVHGLQKKCKVDNNTEVTIPSVD